MKSDTRASGYVRCLRVLIPVRAGVWEDWARLNLTGLRLGMCTHTISLRIRVRRIGIIAVLHPDWKVIGDI